MKNKLQILTLGLWITGMLLAAEECPVNKISLARGLALEVYQIVDQPAENDTRIDAICLKLGRVSAILRRTQGQLPNHPNTPIPPVEWKERAFEIEGFCGVGSNTTLPRGLTHSEYLTGNFKEYVKSRIDEQTTWMKANSDPQESHCPPTIIK